MCKDVRNTLKYFGLISCIYDGSNRSCHELIPLVSYESCIESCYESCIESCCESCIESCYESREESCYESE